MPRTEYRRVIDTNATLGQQQIYLHTASFNDLALEEFAKDLAGTTPMSLETWSRRHISPFQGVAQEALAELDRVLASCQNSALYSVSGYCPPHVYAERLGDT